MIRTLFQYEFLRTRGLIAGIFGIDVLLALVGFAMAVSRLRCSPPWARCPS